MTKLNLFNDYHQLENRITHGFLSTLYSLRSSTVRNLLNKLLNTKGQNITLSRQKLTFDIQSPTVVNEASFSEASKGFLVRISLPDAKVTSGKNSQRQGSQADGWIFDGKSLFLIESKLDSNFDSDQLEKHRDLLRRYVGEDKFGEPEITWQSISQTINRFSKTEELEESEGKVLDQFLELLYSEGITMNFEKLFNPYQEKNIMANWEGNYHKKMLKLLKSKVMAELSAVEKFNDEQKNERNKETKSHYHWLRLFKLDENIAPTSAAWRSTLYITPDYVSVDFFIFKPLVSDHKLFAELLSDFHKKLSELAEIDLRRVYLYFTNYGKRRNVQSGRDYPYANSEFCLADQGKSSYEYKENPPIKKLCNLIQPKQIGLKYKIHNPKKSYWKVNKEGSSINHEDARLLRDPDKVVKKFSAFLNSLLMVFKD